MGIGNPAAIDYLINQLRNLCSVVVVIFNGVDDPAFFNEIRVIQQGRSVEGSFSDRECQCH